ncbi:hypothetical protein SKAU_G00354710 [Synaphobranchus kaupii]|uniref:BPTI/Kunitz inhibitor domain-containing protein n=1 Tax=Synaphobranchus kaupii TaxID=118154 RepID=A0A9Q1IFI1_SYNKA|nr:hypothetical protein SKAU_G00354710 [Synaphobranchus kaupii]
MDCEDRDESPPPKTAGKSSESRTVTEPKPACRNNKRYTVNHTVPVRNGDVVTVAKAMHRQQFGRRLKKLFDPEREAVLSAIRTGVYIGWRCPENPWDCVRVGDGSTCFCGHPLSAHAGYSGASVQVPCVAPSCGCKAFSFIPSRPEEVGEFWLRRRPGFDPEAWRATCRCKHPHEQHAPTAGHPCTKPEDVSCNPPPRNPPPSPSTVQQQQQHRDVLVLFTTFGLSVFNCTPVFTESGLSREYKSCLSGCRCAFFESSFLCASCDKRWEEHQTFFDTEDSRKKSGLPFGEAYLPFAEVPTLRNAALTGREEDESAFRAVTGRASLRMSHTQREEKCSLPNDPGSGEELILKFYYSEERSVCLPFHYKGMEGNTNQFDSDKECMEACSGIYADVYPTGGVQVCLCRTTGVQVGAWIRGGAGGMCELPEEPGPCMARLVKFFYSAEEKTCRTFLYGGCGGNGNRFESREDCLQTCGKSGRFGAGETGGSDSNPDEHTVNTGLIAGVLGGCIFAVAIISAVAVLIKNKTSGRKKVPTKEIEMS